MSVSYPLEDGKRYTSLDRFLKRKFGRKTVKLALDGGFSCPNRDGSKGTGGCTYCSASRAGEFAFPTGDDVREAIEKAKALVRHKWRDAAFIPYFQSGSATYAPLEKLKALYEAALSCEGVVGLALATRPDCLADGTVDYLALLAGRTFLSVELGLQTVYDETAERINRRHTYADFLEGYEKLAARGIPVCVHLIAGLPGETRAMMLESVRRVAALRPFAVKLHLLHVLKGTVCEEQYARGELAVMEKDDYVAYVCDALELLPPDTVIERLTGDGAWKTLVAPRWSTDKFGVLNGIDRLLGERDSYQGRRFEAAVTCFSH